jgi:hypothetical protein
MLFNGKWLMSICDSVNNSESTITVVRSGVVLQGYLEPIEGILQGYIGRPSEEHVVWAKMVFYRGNHLMHMIERPGRTLKEMNGSKAWIYYTPEQIVCHDGNMRVFRGDFNHENIPPVGPGYFDSLFDGNTRVKNGQAEITLTLVEPNQA